jgi:hypothetical protein
MAKKENEGKDSHGMKRMKINGHEDTVLGRAAGEAKEYTTHKGKPVERKTGGKKNPFAWT